MSSITLNGDTSGSVQILVPAVAGSNQVTIAAQTGTLNAAGPAFSYYQSVASSLTSAAYSKVTFTSSEFDTTGGMYSSSRFTPTVAGYYQISAGIYATNAATIVPAIYKNGSGWKQGSQSATNQQSSVSALVFLNGSSDYVEIYAYNSAATQNTVAGSALTYFQGCLLRGA